MVEQSGEEEPSILYLPTPRIYLAQQEQSKLRMVWTEFRKADSSLRRDLPFVLSVLGFLIGINLGRPWVWMGLAYLLYRGLRLMFGAAGMGVDEKWYRKAAEKGDPEVQYRLGYRYLRGNGVKPNLNEAVYWIRKAADQGCPAAQFELGLLYCRGQGVPQDDSEAVNWFRKAADQGVEEAMEELGTAYAHGKLGLVQDSAEAYVWLTLMVAYGRYAAYELQGSLAQKLSPQELMAANSRARRLHEEIQARMELP